MCYNIHQLEICYGSARLEDSWKSLSFLKKTKKIKLHLKDDATARENSEGATLEDIDFTFCSGIDNIMCVVCL